MLIYDPGKVRAFVAGAVFGCICGCVLTAILFS